MADLKPCPFCGSSSIFYDRWYAMHCFSCGAQGPDADDLANEAAAATWNQRAAAEIGAKMQETGNG
ncbi:Lar family restriction alleviation protein [Bordetella bronchiseptica]